MSVLTKLLGEVAELALAKNIDVAKQLDVLSVSPREELSRSVTAIFIEEDILAATDCLLDLVQDDDVEHEVVVENAVQLLTSTLVVCNAVGVTMDDIQKYGESAMDDSLGAFQSVFDAKPTRDESGLYSATDAVGANF